MSLLPRKAFQADLQRPFQTFYDQENAQINSWNQMKAQQPFTIYDHSLCTEYPNHYLNITNFHVTDCMKPISLTPLQSSVFMNSDVGSLQVLLEPRHDMRYLFEDLWWSIVIVVYFRRSIPTVLHEGLCDTLVSYHALLPMNWITLYIASQSFA